ncbi:putative reverse transcriptase domain-containing protein [Tanacetum coccineum]
MICVIKHIPRVVTCFECGAQGHYRKDCPKIKNQNRGNKARVPDARGRAYALGGGDVNPGSNTVTGAAPVARAPYRLAPSEMEELSTQLQETICKGFYKAKSSLGAPVLFVKKKDGSFPNVYRLSLILEFSRRKNIYSQASQSVTIVLLAVQTPFPLVHVIDIEAFVGSTKFEVNQRVGITLKLPYRNSQFLGLPVIPGLSKDSKDCQAYDKADSRKSVKFNWGEKEETAFQTLKQRV